MDFGLGLDKNYGLALSNAANFMFRELRPASAVRSGLIPICHTSRDPGNLVGRLRPTARRRRAKVRFRFRRDRSGTEDASRDSAAFRRVLAISHSIRQNSGRRKTLPAGETARDDFRRWVVGNQHDPLVAGNNRSCRHVPGHRAELRQAALDWYDQNPDPILCPTALGPSTVGAVTNPSYHLMDPSEGIRNLANRQRSGTIFRP